MTGSFRIDVRVELQSAPDLPIAVTQLRVDEVLGAPYRAVFDLAIQDLDVELAPLLGDDVVVTFERDDGVERRLCGVAARLEESASDGRGDDEHQRARLIVAPAFALARHRVNTRMFQNKTVPEILEAVLTEHLGAYGREVAVELEETYDPREYCLQYRESDLDFVHRLLAEEGIAYRFDHEGAVEVMRLTDGNAAFPKALTAAGDGISPFVPVAGVVQGADPTHRFETRRVLTTTAITVRDADFTLGGHVVEAAAEGEDEQGRVRERYEHGEAVSLVIGSYDEGVRRYQKNDAERQAPLRQEAAVAHGGVRHGLGRLVGLSAGTTLSMSGHPDVGVDGDYLVTRVSHHRDRDVLTAMGLSADSGDDGYFNRFECIPLETPWRPPRIERKPTIESVQLAVVTGPAGEEIHVDPHGRIKVQFPWDRENPADETSSCWVRVKQEWAGAGWGFWWVPRIGMEVLVSFIDGDPDRPLVTGCVYDGTHLTPYPLPDEKTKSTIKSEISLGGGGFNELRFEDKAGDEEIFTHAQKDYDEVVENDHDTLVHHDQTNTVHRHQKQTIDVNQTERVDAKQTMTIGGNRTVHVKGDYDETVDGTETRHTVGDVTETFSATEDRSIGASVTETIGADETRDIAADQSETIGASHTLSVGADATLTIAADHSRDATGGITRLAAGNEAVTVAGNWDVTAAGGITIIGAAGVTLMMPGGIKRADSFWHGLMGQTIEAKGYDREGFVGKMGVAGIASAVWITLKADFHSSDRGVNLTKMASKGARHTQSAYEDLTGAAMGYFEAVRISM